jgi:hypothetical protein
VFDLYGFKSKLIPSHIFHISFSIVSILYYFDAFYPISTHASTFLMRPKFRIFLKVKPYSSGLIFSWANLDTSAQCLSFMPSFRRETIKGRFGLNLSIYCLTFSPMATIWLIERSLKYLLAVIMLLKLSSTNFYAAFASIWLNWLSIQISISVYHLFTIDQRVL